MQGMTSLINYLPPPGGRMATTESPALLLASKEKKQMLPQEVTCYLWRWHQYNNHRPREMVDAKELGTLQLGSSQTNTDRRAQ